MVRVLCVLVALRVLILEDDEGVRAATREALARRGCLLTFARDTGDLLALMDESSPPCVVLVDPLAADIALEPIVEQACRRRLPVGILPIGTVGPQKGAARPKRQLLAADILVRMIREPHDPRAHRALQSGSKVRMKRLR